MTSATFTIKGMSCGHCVMAVRKALQSVVGVEKADVEIGKAVVSYDAAKATLEAMKAAIEGEGYDVVATQV